MTDEKKKRIEELQKEIKEEVKTWEGHSRFPVKPPRSQKLAELLKLMMEDEDLEEETQK